MPPSRPSWHWNYRINLKLHLSGEWPKVLFPQENGRNSYFPDIWTINMHSKVFPSVNNAWPFHDHLAIKIINSKLNLLGEWLKPLSHWRPEWISRGFPCVTDEWSLQDHHPIRTLPTWSSVAVSLRRHKQWKCRAAYPVSPTNVLFKTIFWVQLYWFVLLSPSDCPVSWQTWMNVQRLPSVTCKYQFQDHLLSKTII